jgi:hypothetical protein
MISYKPKKACFLFIFFGNHLGSELVYEIGWINRKEDLSEKELNESLRGYHGISSQGKTDKGEQFENIAGEGGLY